MSNRNFIISMNRLMVVMGLSAMFVAIVPSDSSAQLSGEHTAGQLFTKCTEASKLIAGKAHNEMAATECALWFDGFVLGYASAGVLLRAKRGRAEEEDIQQALYGCMPDATSMGEIITTYVSGYVAARIKSGDDIPSAISKIFNAKYPCRP